MQKAESPKLSEILQKQSKEPKESPKVKRPKKKSKKKEHSRSNSFAENSNYPQLVQPEAIKEED